MADTGQQTTEPETEPAKKSPVFMVGMLVCALAGAGAGLLVVGPKVAMYRPAASHSAEDSEGGGHGGTSSGGHGASSGGDVSIFELENVLVNPAGSQGLRFLMMSIAVEVENNDLRDQLHRREAHVRDLVTSVLEKHTLDELSGPGARDAVKAELADAVRPLVGSDAFTVFIPQFVIN